MPDDKFDSSTDLEDHIFELVRDIKDPEKPETLEELDVVYRDGVRVSQLSAGFSLIHIEFTPTIPHCSLATLIGLCLQIKLKKALNTSYKLNISIKEGTHNTAADITKQINDKERVAAAMENPNLLKLVNECINEFSDDWR